MLKFNNKDTIITRMTNGVFIVVNVVFIVSFEHISHRLVFLLLTLSRLMQVGQEQIQGKRVIFTEIIEK